jgi:hypothetical protein
VSALKVQGEPAMKKDNSRKEEKQREIVGIDLGDNVSH